MIDLTLHDLLHQLARRAYVYRPEAPFQLASGQTSPEYVDCRAALSTPWLLDALASHLFGEIRWSATAIGGLTMGADPLAIAVSLKSLQASAGLEGTALRWFSVRKEIKDHGVQGRIVGAVSPGDGVVIIDDVVTSGASTTSAIRACRAEGLVVRQVQAVVDREVGGLDSIQSELDADPTSAARAYALFTLSEVREAWLSLGLGPESDEPTESPRDEHIEHPVVEAQQNDG